MHAVLFVVAYNCVVVFIKYVPIGDSMFIMICDCARKINHVSTKDRHCFIFAQP